MSSRPKREAAARPAAYADPASRRTRTPPESALPLARAFARIRDSVEPARFVKKDGRWQLNSLSWNKHFLHTRNAQVGERFVCPLSQLPFVVEPLPTVAGGRQVRYVGDTVIPSGTYLLPFLGFRAKGDEAKTALDYAVGHGAYFCVPFVENPPCVEVGGFLVNEPVSNQAPANVVLFTLDVMGRDRKFATGDDGKDSEHLVETRHQLPASVIVWAVRGRGSIAPGELIEGRYRQDKGAGRANRDEYPTEPLPDVKQQCTWCKAYINMAQWNAHAEAHFAEIAARARQTEAHENAMSSDPSQRRKAPARRLPDPAPVSDSAPAAAPAAVVIIEEKIPTEIPKFRLAPDFEVSVRCDARRYNPDSAAFFLTRAQDLGDIQAAGPQAIVVRAPAGPSRHPSFSHTYLTGGVFAGRLPVHRDMLSCVISEIIFKCAEEVIDHVARTSQSNEFVVSSGGRGTHLNRDALVIDGNMFFPPDAEGVSDDAQAEPRDARPYLFIDCMHYMLKRIQHLAVSAKFPQRQLRCICISFTPPHYTGDSRPVPKVILPEHHTLRGVLSPSNYENPRMRDPTNFMFAITKALLKRMAENRRVEPPIYWPAYQRQLVIAATPVHGADRASDDPASQFKVRRPWITGTRGQFVQICEGAHDAVLPANRMRAGCLITPTPDFRGHENMYAFVDEHPAAEYANFARHICMDDGTYRREGIIARSRHPYQRIRSAVQAALTAWDAYAETAVNPRDAHNQPLRRDLVMIDMRPLWTDAVAEPVRFFAANVFYLLDTVFRYLVNPSSKGHIRGLVLFHDVRSIGDKQARFPEGEFALRSTAPRQPGQSTRRDVLELDIIQHYVRQIAGVVHGNPVVSVNTAAVRYRPTESEADALARVARLAARDAAVAARVSCDACKRVVPQYLTCSVCSLHLCNQEDCRWQHPQLAIERCRGYNLSSETECRVLLCSTCGPLCYLHIPVEENLMDPPSMLIDDVPDDAEEKKQVSGSDTEVDAMDVQNASDRLETTDTIRRRIRMGDATDLFSDNDSDSVPAEDEDTDRTSSGVVVDLFSDTDE